MDDLGNFQLQLQVFAAAVPGLADPLGSWAERRPSLEICLGDICKETKVATWNESAGSSRGSCWIPSGQECPWRFDDALTFTASAEELDMHSALSFRLRVQSDLLLGVVTVKLPTDIRAVATADLLRHVLPICNPTQPGEKFQYQSSVQMVTLKAVDGSEAGSIAVLFALDANPKELLAAAASMTAATKPLLRRSEATARPAWRRMDGSVGADPGDECFGITKPSGLHHGKLYRTSTSKGKGFSWKRTKVKEVERSKVLVPENEQTQSNGRVLPEERSRLPTHTANFDRSRSRSCSCYSSYSMYSYNSYSYGCSSRSWSPRPVFPETQQPLRRSEPRGREEPTTREAAPPLEAPPGSWVPCEEASSLQGGATSSHSQGPGTSPFTAGGPAHPAAAPGWDWVLAASRRKTRVSTASIS
eukprot:s149_g15.t1